MYSWIDRDVRQLPSSCDLVPFKRLLIGSLAYWLFWYIGTPCARMASRISICRSIEVIFLTLEYALWHIYLSWKISIFGQNGRKHLRHQVGLGTIVCLFFSNKSSLARIAKPEYADQIVRNQDQSI